MVNITQRQSLRFRDAKGNTSRMTFNITGADAAAIETALTTLGTNAQTASNAKVSQVVQGPDRTYGTNATFASVEDKALLQFHSTTTGTILRFQLPAPVSGVFKADAETVDPAGSASGLIAAIVANCTPNPDSVSTSLVYDGGIRLRKKMHRRANIYVKDPTLSFPEE